MTKDILKKEIEVAFSRLNTTLSTIIEFESYADGRKEYSEILEKINSWYDDYKINGKLSIITAESFESIYKKADDLKTKWLFSETLGEESELADVVVIWLFELLLLRNKEITE